METFMFTFSINVDNALLKKDKEIYSSVFKTKFNDVSFSWKIKFRTKTDENNDRPSLYLCTDNGDKAHVDAKFEFVIIPTEKTDIHSRSSLMRRFEVKENANSWGWEKYSKFSFNGQIPKEIKIYSDNCFKILCKIYIPHRCFNQHLPTVVANDEVAEVMEHLFIGNENFVLRKKISDNFFDQVIGSQPADELCDVILQSSDDKSFYCHKVILACASKVFKTMFSRFDIKTNPENDKQCIVEIDDINGDTLMEVLRYIYKNEFSSNLDYLLDTCLYAAEKYDLPDLKSKCIATLKFELSPDNVLDYLDLADQYSSVSLKMGCFEILRLFDHIIDKFQVKAFLDNHNSIHHDMVAFLYKRFDVNLVM